MAQINLPRLAKSFSPKSKEIKYLNKTFVDFREGLIELSKVYFPDTYRDFNESSPGMMFIEMSSYIGDVLSYYIDGQFRESLLTYAQEPANIINIAQAFGFQPKPATAAQTTAPVVAAPSATATTPPAQAPAPGAQNVRVPGVQNVQDLQAATDRTVQSGQVQMPQAPAVAPVGR